MATTYTVKAPDGNMYSVSGPDNASQEDVQAEVLRQHPDAGMAGQQAEKATNYTMPDGSMHTAMAGGVIPQGAKVNGQQSATDGMSTGDLAVAGMGKAFSDTITGAKQLFSSTLPRTLTDQATGTSDASRLNDEVAEQRRLDKALMATHAGQAGELLGHLVIATAVPGGMPAQIASGAIQGALTPTTGNESRALNTALGGALTAGGTAAGKLLGKVVGGIVQPFKNTLSGASQDAVQALEASGVPLDLAQKTGDKLATTLSNIVGDNPLIGSSLNQTQKQAFTAAVLRTLGVNSPTAESGVMQGIKTNIGQTLDRMGTKYPIPLDQTLMTKLANVEAAAASELGPNEMAIIKAQVNNILVKAGEGEGTIAGNAFATVRSSLTRLEGRNDVTGHWAGELNDAMTDALQRNATPQDLAAISHARTSWRILKNLEQPNVIQPDDNISPSALYSALNRSKNVQAMMYGQGDASLQSLINLSAAGKQVLRSQTPNSGTTSRVAGMVLMGSSLGAIDQLARGDPKEALEVGLLGAAGPSIAKMIVQNPQSAKFFAQWARSKVANNFRNIIENQGKSLGTLAGAAIVPTVGGSASTMLPGESSEPNQ